MFQRKPLLWCNTWILDLIVGRAAWAHFPPPFFEDLFQGAPQSYGTLREEAHSHPAIAAIPVGWWSGGHTAAAGALLEMTVSRCGSFPEILLIMMMCSRCDCFSSINTSCILPSIFTVWWVGQQHYTGSRVWGRCGGRLLWWRGRQGDFVWIGAAVSQRSDRCTDVGHHAAGATGGH